MGISDVTRDGVLQALAEYDDVGGEVFLARYGFKPARTYRLVHDGRRYDSKALERSNEAYAWHCTEGFLALGGHRLDYVPKAAVTLVRDAATSTVGIAQIARQLHDWTIS